ncbi:hypothetical protein C5167_019476 [Papaver somniferum]|uniref:Uncharacterized protein n=1 Tax=Papaver somniferum TaxID=3469 RepID=A0A4Y7IQU2_PAPSO|nr:hypothetical protein C5167_019476 [Papaver somniferum]
MIDGNIVVSLFYDCVQRLVTAWIKVSKETPSSVLSYAIPWHFLGTLSCIPWNTQLHSKEATYTEFRIGFHCCCLSSGVAFASQNHRYSIGFEMRSGSVAVGDSRSCQGGTT